MNHEKDYQKINKSLWNQKVDYHVQSEFYDVPNFLKGQSSLNKIELDLLGDITNKSILHLQCHFGQDSISLARQGANVTGVDLSDKAIDQANKLAEQTKKQVNFICSDIYDLPNHLDEKFDIIFTSYGTIGWLPDLNKWAKIISHFLKPMGKLIFVEFHPVVWMFDDDFENISYNYFKSEPIVETEIGTYADKKAPLKAKSVCWNHSLSEVINSLIKNNLEINSLDEYDYSPYNCFNKTIEISKSKFRIKQFENKIPMVYAIVATKKP